MVLCFHSILQTVNPSGVIKANPVRDTLFVAKCTFPEKQPQRGDMCIEHMANTRSMDGQVFCRAMVINSDLYSLSSYIYGI